MCKLSSKSALSSRGEDLPFRQAGPVDLVEGNGGGAALAQEGGDGIARPAPVAAKGHHVRGRQGALHLVTQQHVVFVGLAGDAPVGGHIHEDPLVLGQGVGDGLFGERLPGDAIDAATPFTVRAPPAAGRRR